MKKLFISLIMLLPVYLHAQDPVVKIYEFRMREGQKQHLSGPCTRTDLQKEPYSDWFNKGYNSYLPNTEIMNQLKSIDTKDYSIKIFLATWCIDTHKELPKFLKVLDAMGFPSNAVSLISVSIIDMLHKQSPTHEERGENIYRIPTFIVMKKGVEVNRIVETPVVSHERDLLSILKKESYTPNFPSYPILIRWEKEGLLTDENVSAAGLANQIKSLLRNEGELNTFGYVLSKRDKNGQKAALKIFQMNNYLYPESFMTLTSLADAMSDTGEYKSAIDLLKLAFQRNKDPENVQYLLDLYNKVRGKSNLNKQ